MTIDQSARDAAELKALDEKARTGGTSDMFAFRCALVNAYRAGDLVHRSELDAAKAQQREADAILLDRMADDRWAEYKWLDNKGSLFAANVALRLDILRSAAAAIREGSET